MNFKEYIDALNNNGPAERDTILKWARNDSDISVKEYIQLEKLDVEIAKKEKRKKGNRNA